MLSKELNLSSAPINTSKNGVLTLMMLLISKDNNGKKENINENGNQEDHSSFTDPYRDYFSTLTRGWMGTQKSVMFKNLGLGMSAQMLWWELFSCLIH